MIPQQTSFIQTHFMSADICVDSVLCVRKDDEPDIPLTPLEGLPNPPRVKKKFPIGHGPGEVHPFGRKLKVKAKKLKSS